MPVTTGNDAAVESVSCAQPGFCSAGGYDVPGVPSPFGEGAFVVNEATAATATLALTTSTTSYGDESSVHASVTVGSASGETPTGTVTVSDGSATLCTATLTGGTAACKLRATALPAGTYQLTGSYSGDASFVPAVSAARPLTVSTARTSTRLTLSRRTAVRGREQAERLTVVVNSRYRGVPTGDVIIKAGKAVLCMVTLRSGRGGCSLKASQLTAGKYHVIAIYQGAPTFGQSASRPRTLIVDRRHPRRS